MKTTSRISDLDMGNGRMASTNKEKTDTLNSFFCSVFTRENHYDTPILHSIHDDAPLDDITLTEEIIKNKLIKLNPNKSAGPDGWHPRVVKEVAEALTPPLLIILRKSLDEGSLPDDWKQGNITALHKKGSKANPCNYRPISNLQVVRSHHSRRYCHPHVSKELKEICNTLAEQFAFNSSSDNYSHMFNRYRLKLEKKTIDFDTNDHYSYNDVFTLHELKHAIKV